MEPNERVNEIYKNYENQDLKKINKIFISLLFLEWCLFISVSFFFQQKNQINLSTEILILTLTNLFIGIALSKSPHSKLNKVWVVLSQFLYLQTITESTSGDFKAHLFMFGALAFISMYKDISLLFWFIFLVTFDHFLRIHLFDNTFYGLYKNYSFDSLKFLVWIVFEGILLSYGIKSVVERTKDLSYKQYELESSLKTVEDKIVERTKKLEESQNIVTAQQESLVAASKMSALGEMAGGIAHEINTPLSVIQLRAEQILSILSDESPDINKAKDSIEKIEDTLLRIKKTIDGLRSFSRDSKYDPPVICNVTQIVEDSLSLCNEKIKNKGISVEYDKNCDLSVLCNKTELTQVILNLLSNSVDAIEDLDKKWIKIEFLNKENNVEITHTDSGEGIASNIKDKIMQPFFTTKEIGKGTGLGLSISQGIIKNHRGSLVLDDQYKNTRFVIKIPKNYLEEV